MATFRSIYTNTGRARIAAAVASGTPINLQAMAVGDGNGNPVTPSVTATGLARERYRAAPNRIYANPDVPGAFVAELLVPASEGGFVLREVGVFDENGALFLIGNLPDVYKPTVTDGAYGDTVIRVEFRVENPDIITLQVDPNVVIATRSWVLNAVTACQIAPGGTTGQVWTKKSNACGDAEWRDPTDANVVVDTIEEQQTLAAGQTVVDLTLTTTYGLAVFIEGVRLRADQWTPHPTITTRLTLATSYPAGSRLTAVQNEPVAMTGVPLLKDQNLADVPDKAVARNNLDVLSKAESRQLAPPGMIAPFAGSTAPAGWLKANGAAVSRTTYASLFAYIGTLYGAGDGFNTFNLPDLRGEFVRGWDDARGVDPGRTIGSQQTDQFRAHLHQIGSRDSTAGLGNISNQEFVADFGFAGTGAGPAASTSSVGGTETRPRNRAMLYCIKF